ncbi:MAG: OsmC family protein [Hyphomicrobiales bacterium]|nr:OsmC family protein [Hyphomicrobiales bacterium]MBV8824306.1 OsmC family protein [Hyphomicrobiales bacterium]MBV9426345.1 OsmC family protein [Bradyrhizobiaceae bacterium]
MAHEYCADVIWTRDGAVFTDNRYSRGHVWRFDGGVEVPASSSPLSVKLPLSRADAVDPEEALVAAVSSCHMLFFLGFAAKAGFVVDRYEDEPVGVMTKNEQGKLFVSKITLSPAITFSGTKRPSPQELDSLHHHAHEECYVANSVRAEVMVVARQPVS